MSASKDNLGILDFSALPVITLWEVIAKNRMKSGAIYRYGGPVDG